MERRAAQKGTREADRRAGVRGKRRQYRGARGARRGTQIQTPPRGRDFCGNWNRGRPDRERRTLPWVQPYRGRNRPHGYDLNGPKCGCGNKGCFEALASRTAIFQRIKAGIKDGEKTLLTEMLGDGLEDLRSGDLRKAIRRGDKFTAKIIEQTAEYIGIGAANLINIFNPEVVVLG